jgi:hypothetical protein
MEKKIELENVASIEMDETERKFIIMSRIAVALRRKGLHCSITIHQSGHCNIFVAKHDGDDCVSVDYVASCDATESELLDWWSVIENGVE